MRHAPHWIYAALSLRAVILGLIWGVAISVAVYPNDYMMRGTFLIGNFLPVAVFGVFAGLVLVNVAVGRVVPGLALKGGELAIAIAMALAVCGWPSSGFYRGFPQLAAMPGHWLETTSKWQVRGLDSYLPGGSARVAEGFLLEPREVAGLVASGEGEVLGAVREGMTERDLELMGGVASGSGALGQSERLQLLRVLNEAIDAGAVVERLPGSALGGEAVASAMAASAGLEAEAEAESLGVRREYLLAEAVRARERASRALLVEALGGGLAAQPGGDGVLLLGMRKDPYTHAAYISGQPTKGPVLGWWRNVPWDAWWPVIKTWVGVSLFVGIAVLCLAMIVHPQWSKRELLPYPIARFVEESVARDEGKLLPRVMRDRLFWVAFGVLVLLHSWNAIATWTEMKETLAIPVQLDFRGLRDLFPNLRQVGESWSSIFYPTVYPSVIAFAFFLTGAVSLSLGVSMLLWCMLGAVLIGYGMTLPDDFKSSEGGPLMRFGSYLAMLGIIIYTGRRYYSSLVWTAVGGKRRAEVPGYAVWAMRLLPLMICGSVVLLHQAGLHWVWGTAFVLLMLASYVVLSRIVAETGLFFAKPGYLGMAILTGLVGFEVIGPAAYIVMGFASLILMGDPREALMPFLTNGLQIAERSGRVSPRRSGWLLGGMVVVGLVVAGVVTMAASYTEGYNAQDSWAGKSMPGFTLDGVESLMSQSASEGTLAAATTATGLERLGMIRFEGEQWVWFLVGVALVLGAAVARLRLAWWPLHPVVFLVWGTYPATMFSLSLLIGWMVKTSVVRLGGAKSYQNLRPMMIGVIAGELFAALFWAVAGMVYYGIVGETPPRFFIFPL
ncbi:MAG: DUF6785 family protein [Planctomycetota bacterium]